MEYSIAAEELGEDDLMIYFFMPRAPVVFGWPQAIAPLNLIANPPVTQRKMRSADEEKGSKEAWMLF